MALVIRPAGTADIDLLEDVENAADARLIDHLHAASWWPAESGAARARTPGFLLVAADGTAAEPVGFVHVLEAEGHAHLEQLSVLPEHGRRGIGRALVVAAMGEAARRGHGRMTLRTYASVPWNAPFYGTCGFVETEPDSPFLERLQQVEETIGLARYGRRVQMTAELHPPA